MANMLVAGSMVGLCKLGTTLSLSSVCMAIDRLGLGRLVVCTSVLLPAGLLGCER